MIIGPPPKFHGTWDILGSDANLATHSPMPGYHTTTGWSTG